MAETVLPDAEITTYFLETFVPTGETFDAMTQRIGDGTGMYLLDLMAQKGYRVVSGVTVSFPEPRGGIEYPDGLCVLRVEVEVQEFDIELPEEDDEVEP